MKLVSKIMKRVIGNQKHFGNHQVLQGHLADSCSSGGCWGNIMEPEKMNRSKELKK